MRGAAERPRVSMERRGFQWSIRPSCSILTILWETPPTPSLPALRRALPRWEAVRRTVGMQVTDAYTLLTGDESEARRQTFYQHFRAVARDLQAKGQVSLFPGAGELLSALRAAGVATAVVSTKHTDTLERIFARHGLDQMFSFVIGGDRVSRPKPDPEGLTAGLARLGLTARQALYCGDTVIDAQTAQAAGTDFCAVLNGTTPAAAFVPYPSVHIAPDLPDLRRWLGL